MNIYDNIETEIAKILNIDEDTLIQVRELLKEKKEMKKKETIDNGFGSKTLEEKIFIVQNDVETSLDELIKEYSANKKLVQAIHHIKYLAKERSEMLLYFLF